MISRAVRVARDTSLVFRHVFTTSHKSVPITICRLCALFSHSYLYTLFLFLSFYFAFFSQDFLYFRVTVFAARISSSGVKVFRPLFAFWAVFFFKFGIIKREDLSLYAGDSRAVHIWRKSKRVVIRFYSIFIIFGPASRFGADRIFIYDLFGARCESWIIWKIELKL